MSRPSTSSLSPPSPSTTFDILLETFSKLDEIEGESNTESTGTKFPEIGDSNDGWLIELGIEGEASFFDQSGFGCNRGRLRYTMSGGNEGTAVNDDVGVDKEAEEEEEGVKKTASPALFHSHGFGALVLILDLDLEGVGFGFRSCCSLREVFLSVSKAWEGGLFLGPQSEPDSLLGAKLTPPGLGT